MNVDSLNSFLLWGALVLVAAVIAVRVSLRFGLPSLVVYLLIGIGLGESGIGIEFSDADLAQAFGYAALVIILAEGGLTTRWEHMRPSLGIGVSLATLGSAVSTAIVAVVGHYVLGLEWLVAILLGAVFAPTDAAAVFSTLRRVPLKRRISGVLESESGLNDAPTIVLVSLLSAGTAGDDPVMIGLMVAYQLLGGVVVGYAVGRLGAAGVRRAALPASGLYPLVVLTLTVLAYSAGAAVQTSGFAAVYVSALVLGNAKLPHRAATMSFAEGLAWLAQIGLFVMLGMLSSPSDMPEAFVAALVAGVALTFVARPVSVWLATIFFRMRGRERLFVSWAGLRGAVPVVLATIPLAEGVPRADWLFAVVFIVGVVFTLLQAPTLPWLAARLGMGPGVATRDAEVESAPLERVAADLIQVRVPEGSKLHGVEVGELRVPPGVGVALIVRGDTTMLPVPRTKLRHGDEILIVAPRRLREATERRLRAVGRRGRLAGWFGEDGRDGMDD
ncbi:potassium/proton antiporter (CPA1 family) [Haloactinopolyspora alba]|uniref:Potassium/proton antiporter (CPA1 family) n=1 Tax=Haloactinopolyspora alba TaxID=648780 RepID=A0A2P8E787_9ACTN|nr:potassium/proton antiporter [Haloactinopolyspora alba]PSL05333.1 potassium/proton antiporter (CPA1 family) [Haloactinopolyspora alba]